MCGVLLDRLKTLLFSDIKFQFRQLKGLLYSSVGEGLEYADTVSVPWKGASAGTNVKTTAKHILRKYFIKY